MSVRLFQLYVNARPVLFAFGCIALYSVLLLVLTSMSNHLSGSDALPILAPAFPAILISAATRTPFGETEGSAGTLLPWLSTINLGVFFTGSALFSVAALSASSISGVESQYVRNLAGYLGIAFIGNFFFGTEAGWVPAGVYSAGTMLLHSSQPDSRSILLWPDRPFDDPVAFAVAATFLVVGVVSHVRAKSIGRHGAA